MPLTQVRLGCMVITHPKQPPRNIGTPEQIRARMEGKGVIKRNVKGFIGVYFFVEHRLSDKTYIEAPYHISELRGTLE